MKQNQTYIHKLKHPISKNEIDLCADISEQPMHVLAYERSLNNYCVNCDTQPCMCHLINTSI